MITEKHFIDWESAVFGYGYGTGEPHVIPALRRFLELTGEYGPDGGYGYAAAVMEQVLGPVAAWLLINTLCHADIIEYGTSPRFGWFSPKGHFLKQFMMAHTADQLVAMVTDLPVDYVHCLPDHCNCTGEKCNNQLFA